MTENSNSKTGTPLDRFTDWFPTLTFFGAPMGGTIGLQGRNMRPNSEAASGSRGSYAPARINKGLVEKELLKFIGEIANR